MRFDPSCKAFASNDARAWLCMRTLSARRAYLIG